jgi:hypothetical protein
MSVADIDKSAWRTSTSARSTYITRNDALTSLEERVAELEGGDDAGGDEDKRTDQQEVGE